MSSQTDADQDTLFLERVLDQLYDLGSSPKKKSNPQKKKKRKRHDDEEEEDEEEEVPAETSICADMRAGNAGPDRQKPPKKQPGSNIWPVKQVEVVTFQDPARRPKPQQVPASSKTPASQPTRKKQGDRREELSLEKARLEVHRFGITGYRKEQQRLFEQDRAVMLGARPPKKDFVNYKLLQAQIKGKKQKQKEEVQSGDKKKRKKKQQQSKQKDKKKSSSDPSGAASGQVGRFKNGMLVLSSKEIQKIKKGRK